MQLLLVISMLVISSLSLYAQVIPNDSLYLGQIPPGNTPKIFDLALTDGHRACERIAITSDGKEIYYGELNSYPASSLRTRCYRYEDNKWQGPFNVFEGFMAPKFSGNDSILYLQNKFFYTYFSVRTSTGWSLPVRLISKDQRTHYFQETNLNNSYASSYYEGSPSDGDICKVMVVNQDTILQSLGVPLNSTVQENDFYIAADESYIFLSKNIAGGAGDIYLSFKKDNGKWTNPTKLGAPINKSGAFWEYGQFVSNDNKYLFFTSGGSRMNSYYTYWVKIDTLLDSLRHTNFVPYLINQIPAQSSEAGHLFNYTISDSTFFDDDGNNTLTYSASLSNGNPLPAWLSFDSATRTFSGTPSEVDTIKVKITAKDNADASVSCIFEIYITINTGIEKADEQLPKSINLNQNYPNPFNPSTVISYFLPNSSSVKLIVYNLLGQKIKTLVNSYQSAGEHSVVWNGTDDNNYEAISGVYICRMEADEKSFQRKMLLIR